MIGAGHIWRVRIDVCDRDRVEPVQGVERGEAAPVGERGAQGGDWWVAWGAVEDEGWVGLGVGWMDGMEWRREG